MTDLKNFHDEWLKRQQAKTDRNPCVEQFGEGFQGRHCSSCRHLYLKRSANSYWRCAFRGSTEEHKSTWPSCAKFEPADHGGPGVA